MKTEAEGWKIERINKTMSECQESFKKDVDHTYNVFKKAECTSIRSIYKGENIGTVYVTDSLTGTCPKKLSLAFKFDLMCLPDTVDPRESKR